MIIFQHCISLTLHRSVTLVGEQERKLLKEVVKKAKTPLKTRIVPQGMAGWEGEWEERRGERPNRANCLLIKVSSLTFHALIF